MWMYLYKQFRTKKRCGIDSKVHKVWQNGIENKNLLKSEVGIKIPNCSFERLFKAKTFLRFKIKKVSKYSVEND